MNKRLLILLAILLLATTLRIYKLGSVPNGLYSDETSLGYNAYSLLKTGKDEFGNEWPLSLKSFGDYKPPMSAWLDIPSIYLFGLNEFSVRLPSAVAGIITVLIVYFLTKEIFIGDKRSKISNFLPECSAFLVAITPWHILFTRSNMLVGVEVMFTSAGLLFFLKGLKRSNYFFLSVISFVAAIYSYYGARITIPALLILLLIIFRHEIFIKGKSLVPPILLGLLLLFPLIYSAKQNPLALTGRAKTISIFYDQHITLKIWQAHTLNGPQYPVTLSRFFNNKPYLYLNDILKRYLQHFSLDFLAITGDKQTPFNMQKIGVEYPLTVFFFVLGLYYLIKNATKKTSALIAYLGVSPIAASLTFMTPAANRSANMIIGISVISAVGIIFLSTLIKNYVGIKSWWSIVLVAYMFYLAFFLTTYFITIPQTYPDLWHNGRKEMVKQISKVENNYKKIVVSNSQGPSYIWFLFYNRYDPAVFRQTYSVNDTPDEYGFVNIDSFSKHQFIKPFNWSLIKKEEDTLYVGFEQEIPDIWVGSSEGQLYKSEVVEKVLYPNGDTAFKLVKIVAI